MSLIGRSFFWASLTFALLPGSADAGDAIRQLTILSRPQAVQPQEFQSIQLMAQEWKKLGVDVDIKVQPWEQMSDFVWAERDKWDMTGWQMAGRPERSDPDELLYNLFHSSTAKDGYNFVGYLNPDYDKLSTEQRQETDPEKRKVYDQFGLEFLLRGGQAPPPPDAGPNPFASGGGGIPADFASFFGGTSLLIMVGVILDTLQQVETQLLMRQYDGLMSSGRIQGRQTVASGM